ncbi:selenophosphate-dependent tRNA 2-selenouridine synthase [Gracilibacillus boraciitolerans JCM 21714]|uniref:Selenophosphate-dependent tRNA 2-selenouridine synthase n=1 Tax=Gracilibacillus boraciitolerans JCM 21714 TaxID=1298598 RepID=W4VMK1_9BACI|nr:selenophosphate-dependent tRNA 2-selenouridine synthase [Gracilibacillus boraciitolerans JCM 21714]
MKPKLLVLNGYTGNGKTILLERLAAKGYPVIDLEKIAGHRGSIFGHIGMTLLINDRLIIIYSKNYLIWSTSYILIEGESKRIGKVMMPDWLDQIKEQSQQIFIHLPIEERIRNILDDYQPWLTPDQFMEAFQLIRRRLPTPVAKEIAQHLEEQDFSQAVELLLTYYYDSLYDYSTNYPKSQTTEIYANDIKEAEEQVEELLLKLQQVH